MKKNKVYSFILSFLAVSLVSYNAFVSVTGGSLLNNRNNKICVETVDDSCSLIHSKDSSDVLFEKQQKNGTYCYTMTDCNTGERLGSFESSQNITMDNSIVQNPKLCAAAGSIVWAVMTGGNLLAAISGILAAIGGAANNGTIVAAVSLAIESGGWSAVPAVIGILSASEALIIAVGAGAIA